jgi:hypothetical protein
MEDFHAVHTVLFLSSFCALPLPSFAPPCITSYNTERARHEHVKLGPPTKVSISELPSLATGQVAQVLPPSPSSFLRPSSTINFMGDAGYGHCEFVFATGQGWKTSTPSTRSCFCAASSPSLPRRSPRRASRAAALRGHGMSMSNWDPSQELPFQNFHLYQQAKLLWFFSLPHRRFLLPEPTICFVEEAGHGHYEFEPATCQGWKASTPSTRSYSCAASSPFLPRRPPPSPRPGVHHELQF